jgi:hypothetical protein
VRIASIDCVQDLRDVAHIERAYPARGSATRNSTTRLNYRDGRQRFGDNRSVTRTQAHFAVSG